MPHRAKSYLTTRSEASSHFERREHEQHDAERNQNSRSVERADLLGSPAPGHHGPPQMPTNLSRTRAV
jgi:hypothetical protein